MSTLLFHMTRAIPGRWALALALVAGGCRDADPELAPQAGPAAERGGTAVLAESTDMELPMPLVSRSALDAALSDMLYMSLLRSRWDGGRVVQLTADSHPLALARTYRFLGTDSTAVRFHLRSDARWTDGRPVTARDVVWTYRTLADPELASPRRDYVEQMDSVVAQDDSTVTLYYRRRYPEMLAHATHGIVPAHEYSGTPVQRIATHPSLVDPAGRLVVSGPFQVQGWERGQRITLAPNPHFRPQPNLDRIVIRIIPDATTRLVELQTGGVDMLTAVPPDRIAELRGQAEQLRFEREPGRFYDYIAYNPEAHPAFADPQVRRALGLALDVPALLRALGLQEYASPAGGPYAPVQTEVYDAELTPPLEHDPERARQILEARGWRDTDGDGIREKDGRPLRFSLMTNAGSQRREGAAQVVQRQLREVGVDARVQLTEWNTMAQRLVERDYEAALSGWGVELSPRLVGVWGPDVPFNVTGYRNPEVVELMERAQIQPTAELANPLWRQAAARIVRDQPYTWLYYVDVVHVVRDRLRGTRIDVLGPYQNPWEWWIPADRREASR